MTNPKRIGEYELLEVLGRGSFGTVWEARHVTLNRLSALKVLNPKTSKFHSSDRFLREAQIAARLKHPNIVRLLEVGEVSDHTGDVDFLCYELIEGVTLAEWAQFTSLDYHEIANLFEKVASALEYAHESGVVHRDLKPDNILVDLSGEPHITDFGLARKLDDRLTETNITLGTIAYMSPEQARGASNEADARSDIFSVGAMLFEVLTKRLPFAAENIPAYLFAVSNSPAKSPLNFDAKIPKDLATICGKSLRLNPDDRYQSAAALADDLRRFKGGLAISARPVSLTERLQRWCLRKPVAATLIGVLCLLAIIGPMIAMRQIGLRRNLLLQSRSLDESNRTLRTAKYNNDLYLAYQAWNEGRIQETRGILDRALPDAAELDLREFSWHLLNDRLDAAYEVVAKSDKPVNQFAITPDKRFLVVSDQSNQLGIWDFAKRQLVRSIPLSESGHHAIAILNNSILVGDKCGDNTTGRPLLCVHEIKTGKRTSTIPIDADNNIEKIAVSPSKDLIAVGVRYDGVYFYNTSFEPAGYVENHGLHRNLSFSPDGK